MLFRSVSSFNRALGSIEQDKRGYQSANPNSSAVGKYQHLWNLHKDQIAKITGVTNVQDYLNNPQAQEKYQEHLEGQYKSNVPYLRKNYPQVTNNVNDELLMALQHYLGLGDAKVYLDTLNKTKSYEAAQQAVNDSIEERTGKPAPVNRDISEYLSNFLYNLESPTAVQQPKTVAPTTTPKTASIPKVNPNPTLTPSPYSAPVANKPQVFSQPKLNE